FVIIIGKEGSWHHIATQALLNRSAHELLTGTTLAPVPMSPKQSIKLPEVTLDVIFPVLHGPFGEDGTVQGFLKLARIPFVGADVCGSAIGMDKDVQKRILRDAGIPVASWRTLYQARREHIDPQALIDEFGLPLFVKPANLGSSIAITKAKSLLELTHAL